MWANSSSSQQNYTFPFSSHLLCFFQYKSQESADTRTVSPLAACTVQPAIWQTRGDEWTCCGTRRLSATVPLCLPRPYRRQGAGGREWRPVTPPWAARRCPLSLALHGCLCLYLHSARLLFMCWGTFLQSQCMCSQPVWATEASRTEAFHRTGSRHICRSIFAKERFHWSEHHWTWG